MSIIQGYKTKVIIFKKNEVVSSADGSISYEIDKTQVYCVPTTKPALRNTGTLIDVTNSCGNGGYKQRERGIGDWSIDASSIYDDENPAIKHLQEFYFSKDTSIKWYVYFLTKGYAKKDVSNNIIPTIGYEGAFIMESFSISSDVNEIVRVDMTLIGDGELLFRDDIELLETDVKKKVITPPAPSTPTTTNP
ncbi:hypothetical protein AB832_07155 [Flavobacteriaceae bacterium (ex Bugula neritina AB1)]|nr:hypothetical protein AB832_07155 [Flavobacteriaceae bacterium (ex Bugula neritina AB1)]